MVKPLRRLPPPEPASSNPDAPAGTMTEAAAPSSWGGLVMPGAVTELSLFASARSRHQLVDAVMAANRLGEWLVHFTAPSQPDANRQWFMEKLWVKGLPRMSNAAVDVSVDGVEALLSRLDAGEHARVIEGVVSPGVDGGAFSVDAETVDG